MSRDELLIVQAATELLNMKNRERKIEWEPTNQTGDEENYVPMERRKTRESFTGGDIGLAIVGRAGCEGLGERLACVRQMRRMSQDDLAAKIGADGGMTISHWECGRRTPHARHLRALCIALNVSADYLLDSHG